ncbi:MAG TPA: MotA/TolQ/ExbB proton channel family protein, partial [Ferruginibacter sp.]|nr:MotA/TolQ/ExbB proton channel family protein [Ferruginibacter sp.]
MFTTLLQFDSTAISTPAAGSESLFSILVKGGVLMIPLALFMALAIFFFIERLLYIRKASKIEDNFMNIIRDHILSGNITAARSLAKNTQHPVAKMIDKGIQRIGKPIDAIERNMDNIGKLEIYKMEKNLPVLSVIARIAPLFGFVGTIIGLVMLLRDFAAAANPTIP